MRRRSHIGGQAPEALHELASDPRIAFGLEFPPAIIADGQKNLHELHGVSRFDAGQFTLTTRALLRQNRKRVCPTSCFANRSDARETRFAVPTRRRVPAKEQLRFECVGPSPWRNQ